MAETPEVRVEPRSYYVSCMPPDADDFGSLFAILVVYRGVPESGGPPLWVVTNRTRYLGADGEWSWGYVWEDDREPVTDAEIDAFNKGEEEWKASHRFPEAEALRRAYEAAPLLGYREWTVESALADLRKRSA